MIYLLTGVMPAIFVMEQIMEHVSRTVGKEPLVVKTLNLYQKDQVWLPQIAC